jgi:endonuclease YncB( thermonuclease family)
MVFGKTVEVDRLDVDRHGRTVALVRLDSKCVNEQLIRAEFAWVYPQYCMTFEGTLLWVQVTASAWVNNEHRPKCREQMERDLEGLLPPYPC